MKNLHLIFAFFIFNICFGQIKSATDCNLQTENSNWKTKFENAQNKAEKIYLIKQKIYSDSIYSDYKESYKSHHITYTSLDKLGNDCGCKILFILYSNTKSLTLNQSGKPKLILILENLNENNIDQISSVFDKSAESLYGTYGKCGVVILNTKNKKVKKFIKKTGL